MIIGLSLIALSKNIVYQERSKYIDIQFHNVQELVAKIEVLKDYLHTEELVVNIFTKPLKIKLFHKVNKKKN